MKELFELNLRIMTIDEYEKRFLELLSYVGFIKNENVKIQNICEWVVGIIDIDVKQLMMSLISLMSYYGITIHTKVPRLIYKYRFTSILKEGCM